MSLFIDDIPPIIWLCFAYAKLSHQGLQTSLRSFATPRDSGRTESERAAAAVRAKEEAAKLYLTRLPAWRQQDTFSRSDKDVLKHLKLELTAMEEQVHWAIEGVA